MSGVSPRDEHRGLSLRLLGPVLFGLLLVLFVAALVRMAAGRAEPTQVLVPPTQAPAVEPSATPAVPTSVAVSPTPTVKPTPTTPPPTLTALATPSPAVTTRPTRVPRLTPTPTLSP